MHESGSGRVLLAWKPEIEQQNIIENLADIDDSLDAEALKKSLPQIQRKGFAKVNSSIITSLVDISFPIFIGDSDQVIGTLTVPFLKGTSSSPAMKEVQQLIANTARQLSELSVPYSGSL